MKKKYIKAAIEDVVICPLNKLTDGAMSVGSDDIKATTQHSVNPTTTPWESTEEEK